MSVYGRLGIPIIINAKGPATRLSGGMMRPEVTQAMAEAAEYCVDIAELQARASQIIAEATGAEAGYVASGAAACLLLATAACVAGLDPAKMARLPDTSGMKNEVVMVRSQRNFYDHAVRGAGVKIIEVGLPDRFAGAGVRDAEVWEIEAAISESTAAVFYVVDTMARPPLTEVCKVAHAAGVPVFVDAAAQLPPQANLKRFIAEGADLVAFSGGKAIGGPQASGFLCGRRDLIMSAALQHLDLDIFREQWTPPASLVDKSRLKGVPQHGIGRPCKAGKEEIVGLLTALQLFIAEGDAIRHARWLTRVRKLADGLAGLKQAYISIIGDQSTDDVPQLELALDRGAELRALDLVIALQNGKPSIHVDSMHHERGLVVLNPMCFKDDQVGVIVQRVRELLS